MGVHYDVVGVFGVQYSFSELENFMKHEETIAELEKLEYDCGPFHVWSDVLDHQIASPGFDLDDEDCVYLVGYRLKDIISPVEMRQILQKEDEVRKQVREFSEKYNVANKEDEVGFVYLPNVS